MSKRINGVHALPATAFVLWATFSEAHERVVEPARLENAAEVAALISFPETAQHGDIVIIRCGTTASRQNFSGGLYELRGRSAIQAVRGRS